MLKLCRVTKVKVFFLVLVYVFNFNLFEFSAAILEKGLLPDQARIPIMLPDIPSQEQDIHPQPAKENITDPIQKSQTFGHMHDVGSSVQVRITQVAQSGSKVSVTQNLC